MNIYNAILAAADHIERHPDMFRFSSITIPDGCGTPGCAIGWIAYFYGMHEHEGFDCIAVFCRGPEEKTHEWITNTPPMPISTRTFYIRMDEFGGPWIRDARLRARNMRLYANKYHAPAKPVSPPDWNAISAKWTVGDDVRSQEVTA
jgi:hypothetical protein